MCLPINSTKQDPCHIYPLTLEELVDPPPMCCCKTGVNLHQGMVRGEDWERSERVEPELWVRGSAVILK